MPDKAELRELVRKNLSKLVAGVNLALAGKELGSIEPVLQRIGIRHWYAQLKDQQSLPNLDGKTVGTIVEMLMVGVLETKLFHEHRLQLRINPAKGVDLPDLDLGVKSPSENYDTSEPFFSAYERLHGSDFDAVVLLTDYQSKKDQPPLRLQIIQWRYLRNTEIADENLCKLALKHRAFLLAQDEVWARKVFRFLAHVNQGDWRARFLIKLIGSLDNAAAIKKQITAARNDFEKKNKKNVIPIPTSEIDALERILACVPLELGVIDAADSWVEQNVEWARMPNGNEC